MIIAVMSVKVRSSTGFEPVPSRYQCDALTKRSYEATDVESWSVVGSNEPLRNECEVIYEIFHILNCRFEIN